MEQEQISLVLPCYKPESGWSEKILLSYKALTEHLPGMEIFLIVINDGSPKMAQTDIDILVAGIKNFAYYGYPANRGKGYALRYGVHRAQTNAVVYTDLDFPYTIDSLVEIVQALKNFDVAIGIKGKRYYDSVPFWRKRISRWSQDLIRLFLPNLLTADTQCGLKAFKGVAKEIFLETKVNDYLFDLEFVVALSKRKNITTTLQEVHLRDNVKFGKIPVLALMRELVNLLKIISHRR